MPDMLVKLYELPPLEPALSAMQVHGISLRRGLAPEKHLVLAWIREHFGNYWASETDVAFSRQPISCFVATAGNHLLGFACYDSTGKGFFGPTGVSEAARGKGVGKALLLQSLHSMFQEGYGYAIIGGVGPAEFYAQVAGAVVIPDSDPGIYRGLLSE